MLPPLSDSEPPVLAEWLAAHGAELVECVVPDFNGIARGKILTVEKFLASVSEGSLYMPESALLVTVSGEYAKAPIELGDATIDHDVSLVLFWFSANPPRKLVKSGEASSSTSQLS